MVRVKWMKRRGGRSLLSFRYILYCAGIWLHLLVMTGMLAGLGCGPGGAKSSFEVEKGTFRCERKEESKWGEQAEQRNKERSGDSSIADDKWISGNTA